MVVATAIMLAPFIVWVGWPGTVPDPSAPGAGQPNTPYLSVKPARTIALANATQADLLEAFAFTRIGIFPTSNLIYVQRSNAQNDAGDLIDRSGRWVAAADFNDPNFSGDPLDGLFPARRGQEWGYINEKGAWAIAPQFRATQAFKNGVAVVYAAGGFGLIDTHGKWLVPAKYKSVLPVAQGWVVADDTWYVQDNSWYALGNSGTWKITTHPYSWIGPFNDRLVVGKRDDKMMLVDRTASPATAERYEQVLPAVNGRAPAKQGGKWGVISAQGAWLIAPQFDALSVNEDGSFQVQQQDKSMLLNNDGKPTPATSYRLIGKPSEGLTGACQELRCGYVDQSGKWAIAPQFENVWAFSDGVARVTKYGLVVYIDRSGRMLTPEPPANAAAPWLWRPGAMRDANSNNGGVVFGYLDRSGKLVIPAVFSRAGDFSENLAPVQAASDGFGYIGPDGNWAIPPVFRAASPFAEGWAMVSGSRLFSGNSGYIDVQGHEQLRLPAQFQSGGSFKDGKASVLDWSAQPSIIDKTGKTVTATATSPAVPALQRLSINGGKWGYADAQDHFVIAPQFDAAGEFSGEHAPVKIGEKWGYINRSGKIVIRPAFDEVGQFSEGLARVKQGEFWTFIDPRGIAITSDAFVVAGDFHGGRATVGMGLEAARRRAAGVGVDVPDNKLPSFTPNGPPMIAEGGDMSNGMVSIKLVSGGYYNNYLIALLNKQGELVIPAVMPPPANAAAR